MWVADNIVHSNMLFYPLYYDIIRLTNQITQSFHFLLGFAENQRILRFKIVFGLDNGDSDLRVQIMVLLYALLMRFIINFVIIWMVYTFTDYVQAPYIQLSDIKKQYLID